MADFSWVPKELEGRFSYINKRLVASCEICGEYKATRGRGSVLKRIADGHLDQFRFCTAHGPINSGPRQKSDKDLWPIGTKRCTKCLEIKPFDDFHKHKTAMFGYNTICKLCRESISKNEYASRSREQLLWERAKARTRINGREFTISIEDIVIPEVCPILGTVLEKIVGDSQTSPSLDRINPNLGYTSDNIMVISARANTLKNNMTHAEAVRLENFLRPALLLE